MRLLVEILLCLPANDQAVTSSTTKKTTKATTAFLRKERRGFSSLPWCLFTGNTCPALIFFRSEESTWLTKLLLFKDGFTTRKREKDLFFYVFEGFFIVFSMFFSWKIDEEQQRKENVDHWKTCHCPAEKGGVLSFSFHGY